MPLAIDFGTTNTTAGTYLDSGYLEKLAGDPVKDALRENQVNYVTYEKEGMEETPLLPSVVGITQIDGERVQYMFGHQADRLFHMSYIEEGFCVFYDIKRWISNRRRRRSLWIGRVTAVLSSERKLSGHFWSMSLPARHSGLNVNFGVCTSPLR